MPEITVDVPDDVAFLADRLEPVALQRIVSAALRERASEELLFDVADSLLTESELTDEVVDELTTTVNTRVAERHRHS